MNRTAGETFVNLCPPRTNQIYLAEDLAEYIKTEVELIARDDVCLITVTLPLNSTT